MINWFRKRSRNEKFLLLSLVFLAIMLALNWQRVKEGFRDGLEKFGIEFLNERS